MFNPSSTNFLNDQRQHLLQIKIVYAAANKIHVAVLRADENRIKFLLFCGKLNKLQKLLLIFFISVVAILSCELPCTRAVLRISHQLIFIERMFLDFRPKCSVM